MSTKMRIRDLVAELGAQGREIMRIVHELGIEAKTQMSGLTEEQVEAVRKRYEASQNAPVETRVAGEVVVRRRRRTTRSSAPKDDREGEASAPAAKEAPQASEEIGRAHV